MAVQCLSRGAISFANVLETVQLWQSIWPDFIPDAEEKARDVMARVEQYDGPAPQAPRIFVARRENRICATSAIMPRMVSSQDGPVVVMGLAGVAVAPERRGQGLGAAMVRSAFALVDQSVFAWSLFQTADDTLAFYEKLGCRRVANRFVNGRAEDPAASPWWEPCIVIYPDRDGWPAGDIDLNGPGY